MGVWVGVAAAVLAGTAFATAGVLQQRAASEAPAEDSLTPRLLAHLAHQPLWLAGIGAALVSYALQSVALAFAPLALVQPLIVTELIFAIPVSARLRRVGLTRRAWGAIVAVAAGLALGLWAADPTGSDNGTPARSWLTALALTAVLAATLVLVGRRLPPTPRASTYAAAAAVVLGMQSGLLDRTVHLFENAGVAQALTSWAPYAMAAAALTGTLLIQSAFQAGPLAVTLPVNDIVEPLSASAIGVFLLGEQINGDAPHLLLVAVGVATAATGIVTLDRSPEVHRLRDAQSCHPTVAVPSQGQGAAAGLQQPGEAAEAGGVGELGGLTSPAQGG